MAHLSFAELLQRQVPLSAGEAVALTLAAAAAADSHGSETQRVAVPDIEQLLLSSTGHVSFGPGPFPPHDDPAAALVFVLTRLLGIDEQRGDSSGRIPGGLLIVLARMRRQIDLPPLSIGALREALGRFSAGSEPAALAAVFWRAARMRARTTDRGLIATRRLRTRVERRANGPSTSELRHWLRQAEKDVYDLKRGVPVRAMEAARQALQQFKAAAGAIALVALLVGATSIGLGMFATTSTSAKVPASEQPSDVPLSAARATVVPRLTTTSAAVIVGPSFTPSRQAELQRTTSRQDRPRRSAVDGKSPSGPSTVAPQQQLVAGRPVVISGSSRHTRPSPPVTVRMVNLPRPSWSVNR